MTRLSKVACLVGMMLPLSMAYGQGFDRLLSQSFVFVTPTPFIDGQDAYGFRGGLETRVHGKFRICLEAGGYFHEQYGRKHVYHAKTEVNGYQLRPSIKYYPFGDEKYIQVEYMYKWQNFNYKDSISLPSTPVYEKQYNISKAVACINVKYGITGLWGRFVFDGYIGGGIRIIHSTCTLTTEEEAGILKGEGHGDLMSQGGAGIWHGPNLSFGIKIGYLFRKPECSGSLTKNTMSKPYINSAKQRK